MGLNNYFKSVGGRASFETYCTQGAIDSPIIHQQRQVAWKGVLHGIPGDDPENHFDLVAENHLLLIATTSIGGNVTANYNQPGFEFIHFRSE